MSPDLAKELLDTAKGQLASEAARQSRLDGKANSLMAAAGLSLTVASSIAGTLISRGTQVPLSLLTTSSAMGVLGLAAVVFGIWAAKIQDHGTLNPEAIFNEQQLNQAEAPPGTEGDSEETRTAFGLALYRQYITVHIWDVYERNAASLDRKATFIKLGQYSFIGFLVALMISEVLLLSALSSSGASAPLGPELSSNAMPQKPPPPPPPPPPTFRQDDMHWPLPPPVVAPQPPLAPIPAVVPPNKK